ADQVDMVNRRLEWMAASALSTGTVTIAGEGFPTTLIDFGRSASLTLALSGSSVWGSTLNSDGRDTNITGQLTAWAARVLKASGAQTVDIVFTNTPWQRFLGAEGVQGAIYFPNNATSGNNVNPGTMVEKGAVFMGKWGQFNLYLYNDWYIDPDTNIEQPMVADGTIIMSGPDLKGTRAFGMIMDPKFNYRPMAYAPKTWIVDDPAQRIIMMQSAPLVIPSRVNASIAITVCAPASY
ncbi:MAG: major capsid protein, partial [Pseudomonadota bacterium]|nr:major capsid protein [Pseudomonadota bacterium]